MNFLIYGLLLILIFFLVYYQDSYIKSHLCILLLFEIIVYHGKTCFQLLCNHNLFHWCELFLRLLHFISAFAPTRLSTVVSVQWLRSCPRFFKTSLGMTTAQNRDSFTVTFHNPKCSNYPPKVYIYHRPSSNYNRPFITSEVSSCVSHCDKGSQTTSWLTAAVRWPRMPLTS